MKLLLSGFEPFGGSSVNSSEQITRALNGTKEGGFNVNGHILPVDGEKAPGMLINLVEKNKPDAIVCLGEAPHRPVISIERVALNLLDYRIPDNCGKKITDQPVRPGGPAAYFATLPVREIVDSLLENSIPAELSLSAGAYLCNQVLYTLLDHLALNDLSIPAGFIHLPSLPEQAAKTNALYATMGIETSLKGIKFAIGIIFDQLKK